MRRALGGVVSGIVTVVVVFSANDGLLRTANNMEESNRSWAERHEANPDAYPMPAKRTPTMRDRFNETVLATINGMVNFKRRVEGSEPLTPDLPAQPNRDDGVHMNPF